MTENHKSEWENLLTGERVELGLVQIDIVGHSAIKASERTLKRVRDILYEEAKEEIRRLNKCFELQRELFNLRPDDNPKGWIDSRRPHDKDIYREPSCASQTEGQLAL